MKSTTSVNIVTCLSIKDVLTFALECKIYENEAVRIYLISKRTTRLILKYYYRYTGINYVDETRLLREMLGINDFKEFLKINNQILCKRAGWYKQQFLKYCQILSLKENAFIVDGDTFPKSIFVLSALKDYRSTISYAPVHEPYEVCIDKILGPSIYYDLSRNYVCEAFYMDYTILNEMLLRIESRCKVPWPKAVLNNVTSLLGFSEYQTYARFEEDRMKGKINIKEFNTTRNFGFSRIPGTGAVKNASTEFVSFESYDLISSQGNWLFKIKLYILFTLNKINL